MEFRVLGLGFMGLGVRILSSGFEDLGLRVYRI